MLLASGSGFAFAWPRLRVLSLFATLLTRRWMTLRIGVAGTGRTVGCTYGDRQNGKYQIKKTNTALWEALSAIALFDRPLSLNVPAGQEAQEEVKATPVTSMRLMRMGWRRCSGSKLNEIIFHRRVFNPFFKSIVAVRQLLPAKSQGEAERGNEDCVQNWTDIISIPQTDKKTLALPYPSFRATC